MAAGNVTVVFGRFQAKIIIILSKLLLELIRKALFILNKEFCLHQEHKLITSRSQMLQPFANGREWSQLPPLEF